MALKARLMMVLCTRDTAVCEIYRDMNRFRIVLKYLDKNHCLHCLKAILLPHIL